jgi:hypothetical protein
VSELRRSAARGVLGAMAMTGMRRVTTGLGLVHKPPPERIATEGVPGLLSRVGPERRDTAIEIFHWGVGAVGGIGFGLIPKAVRRQRWAGPLYGLAILGVFESAIAPRLGLGARDRALSERLALAGDHVLYGIVLRDEQDAGAGGQAPRRHL